MTFLRNAWYAAAWGNEVTRQPLGRTLLSERVALYRKEDGGLAALSDICPHRFAVMHKGKVSGDALQCPYHGLQFSPSGACHHNPHGEIIPPALRLKAYPIVERDNIAWIWMGEASLASEVKIPDFKVHSDSEYVTIGARIGVKGSYQLVTDNLLDLSHTQFLHPLLVYPDDPETRNEGDLVQDGDILNTTYDQFNTRATPFINFIWPDAPERLNSLNGVRWQAPANMLLKVHFASRDTPAKTIKIWGAQLVTPETETTSHYFFSIARDFRRDDEQFGTQLLETIRTVFSNEDAAMIGEVQANMGDQTDLIAMRPVILPTDSAAVRARMILRKLIKAEAEAAGALERAA